MSKTLDWRTPHRDRSQNWESYFISMKKCKTTRSTRRSILPQVFKYDRKNSVQTGRNTISWTLHADVLQRYGRSWWMLHQLRRRCYCRNLPRNVQDFIDNCRACIKVKPTRAHKLRSPIQSTFDPCYGQEFLLDLHSWKTLPASRGFFFLLIAVGVFFRLKFSNIWNFVAFLPCLCFYCPFSRTKLTSFNAYEGLLSKLKS